MSGNPIETHPLFAGPMDIHADISEPGLLRIIVEGRLSDPNMGIGITEVAEVLSQATYHMVSRHADALRKKDGAAR